MKFLWFHLMPYDRLPENFPQKHRSVWVDPPSSLGDPQRIFELYNLYLDQLEYADKMGFDAIGVNEHHQNAYGLMPSPNLMAAALARRTQQAAICVMGNSLALYNPPVRVAEEFAMLDCISGGRLIAGFPVGTAMDTSLSYGISPSTLRDRYYEAHELVMRAWNEPDMFHFNGRFSKLRYVNIWPRPLQKPHPPVWIPGGGSVETWSFCAENDYVYAALSFGGYIRGKGSMEGFWEELERQGKPYNPFQGGFAQIIAVSETDEKAEEEYGAAADYFFNNCLHLYPPFVEPGGYRTLDSVKMSFHKQVAAFSAGPGSAARVNTWKEMVDGGQIIAGSPATVRDRLKDCIEGLRIGNLFLIPHFGNMSHEQTLKNTELLAKEVVPHLRDYWQDYDNPWWPQGYKERLAANA